VVSDAASMHIPVLMAVFFGRCACSSGDVEYGGGGPCVLVTSGVGVSIGEGGGWGRRRGRAPGHLLGRLACSSVDVESREWG
jgi:hypothetical protein